MLHEDVVRVVDLSMQRVSYDLVLEVEDRQDIPSVARPTARNFLCNTYPANPPKSDQYNSHTLQNPLPSRSSIPE